MEEEFKYGLMVQDMRAIGSKIKPMEEEDSSMLMEMCMRVTGKMINHRDMACIYTQMGLNTKENGLKISKKDMDWRLGQTKPSTRVVIKME